MHKKGTLSPSLFKRFTYPNFESILILHVIRIISSQLIVEFLNLKKGVVIQFTTIYIFLTVGNLVQLCSCARL